MKMQKYDLYCIDLFKLVMWYDGKLNISSNLFKLSFILRSTGHIEMMCKYHYTL